MTVEVIPFFHAGSNTFSYLAADPASGDAAVIDPVLEYDPHSGAADEAPARALVDAVRQRGWRVQWLLETHAHADHVSAARWLKRQWPQARVGIGAGIVQVQRTFAGPLGLPQGFRSDGTQFDHLFVDGERFAVGGVQARVIAVPGHTPDSIAYLIGDALFPGDSIFMPDGGTARCDFPGGDAAQLYRSIRRLYELADATRMFVCHDYGPGGREVACQTSIGEQKRGNIHVRADTSEQDFVRQRSARDATLAPPRLMQPAVRANIQGGALPD